MKILFSLLVGFLTLNAVAQGTAFTYEGVLNDGGRRAGGVYDLFFTLFDSTNQPGNVLGKTVTNTGVAVSNGWFRVSLDFGNVFDGGARWLEIGVRTNGAIDFVALIPRQLLTPVPYAIFSGATTNLVGPLSTANLAPVAVLIASASNGLSSAFSTNIASFTNNGLETAADAIRLASVPDQQGGIQRTPIRGYVSWYATAAGVTEGYVSNVMFSTKATGLYDFGYDWIFVDDGWGTTNRDANGNVQWNTNKFPSGAGFVNVAHRMGFKVALYTDGGGGNGLTSSQAQSASDVKHIVQDVNQFLKWGLDGGKWDMPSLNFQLGMAVLATNTTRPFYLICGNPYAVENGVPAQWVMMMNAFRGGGGVGDVVSFARLMAWCDQFATNGFYRWIRPGHVYDFDGIFLADTDVEPGTRRGTQSQIVMDAISSGIMLHSYSDPNGFLYYDALSQLTNSSILQIQGDPAVIAGQRIMQTNNIDVWLKPLGSEAGPEFAAALICRAATSNITVTIPFDSTGFNLPAAAQQKIGYSVYDCISNKWVSATASPSLTVTLTNHQPSLFRLFPGSAITTNYIQPFSYAPTLPAIVLSNGVQRIVNLAWDPDVANFIARARLTNDPIQCYAIQFLFTKLKTMGLWTNRLDVLYPMVPGQPYLNAFSSSFTIIPVGSVSSTALGIAGDGSSGYFNTGYHYQSSAIHFSINSGSIGIYNGTVLPVGAGLIGGLDVASGTHLANGPDGTISGAINDPPGTGINYSGNATGLWVASRISSNTAYAFGKAMLQTRLVNSLLVPNTYVLLDAVMQNGAASFECDARLQGAWIGGGLTPAEMSALNEIWNEYEGILGRRIQ